MNSETKKDIYDHINKSGNPRKIVYDFIMDLYKVDRPTAKLIFYTVLFNGNAERVNRIEGVTNFTEEDHKQIQWIINVSYAAEIEKSV